MVFILHLAVKTLKYFKVKLPVCQTCILAAALLSLSEEQHFFSYLRNSFHLDLIILI